MPTENIVVKMDTYNSSQIMCGLALFQNVNDETFSAEKIVQFYQGHKALDRAFGWGMEAREKVKRVRSGAIW